MADEYDPGHQGGAWDNDGYDGVTGGDEQEQIQHSTEEDQAENSVDQETHASGDPPSNDGTTDDVGDYDPASVVISTPDPEPASVAQAQVAEQNAPSKPSPQPVAKKPRTAGGFLVGDSDSEEEDDEQNAEAPVAASSGLASGPVSQPSVPQSPPQPSMTGDGSASNVPPVSQVNPAAAVAAPANSYGNFDPSTQSALGAAASPVQQSPPDRIAQLEERVQEDPRGAMDSWLDLIGEHRARNNIDASRQVYDRFLAVFPQAADIWAEYLDMELSMNNFPEAERIFGKCLMNTKNVNLWTKYLDYIRRRNDLNDSTGQARTTVSQAYEFVIDNIGLDKDSGKIWAEYIQFIKFGPGTVGGSQWQDQQKMDQLRKAYQRAICVPIANVNTLWKEYDQFELGLNKLTGRKYLAEKSPAYISAKSANTALENITRGLKRINLPRLPPALGFEGDQEYMEQVELWKKWIAWEKSDPLDLKDDKDQPGLLQKRILYVYNQALMALRFWPEMWVDAAQWCIDENVTLVEGDSTKDGNDNALDFITRGMEANPESVLLALKHADHIESTYPIEENDAAKIARGEAVKAPYNKVLDTLYGIIKKVKDRETAEIARVEEMFAAQGATNNYNAGDDDDDDIYEKGPEDDRKNEQIRLIQQGSAAQTQVLSRTISFVWIALIRAMRRIQGKGKPGTPLGGMRQAFTDARQRGKITSDVYAAVAQLEWTIYKEPAGGKIFDRGARLFPEDENFTLENIKYLHSRDDFTNARVLFETVVNRLTQKPESVHKAKPLYAYFHKYESQFGELSQIAKLEKRMAELFPEDPKLAHFNARYSSDKFDPIATRIIVSPAAQLRPKAIMQSIEQGPGAFARRSLSPRPQQPPPFATQSQREPSPRPVQQQQQHQYQGATNSPKRPLPMDDFEDNNPPRKIQRGEQHYEFQRGASPLKGAAGRRLDQQRRMQGAGGGSSAYNAGPAPIARDITFLLSQIPRTEFYDYHRFNPIKMVNLLRETDVPDHFTWKQRQADGGEAMALRGGGHHRQASGADYGGSRDSPVPGRPMSPYGADGRAVRLATAQATYRQSSLRPGSSGSYEPPPAVYSAQQAVPPPPPQFAGFDPNSAPPPGWVPPPLPQGYGVVPPPPIPGYGTPVGGAYGQPPPQQGQQGQGQGGQQSYGYRY